MLSRSLASCLFCSALTLGCGPETPAADTQAATTSSASSDESGAVTSTSAPTMATATDSAATTEACPFMPCEDTPMEPLVCDNWAQDCPEGQKCAAYISEGSGAWDAVQCVDVIGTDRPGEACTAKDVASGRDSCIEGAMCWAVDANGVGTCVALCTGSPDAPVCAPLSTCTVSNGGVLNLCFPLCNPLLQDCPFPSDVCYASDGTSFCAPDAEEPQQVNQPCTFINDCDRGLNCSDAALVGAGCLEGMPGCCTPYCEVPDGACPNPDQQCVPIFDPLKFPGDHPLLLVGICGVAG